MPAKAEDLDNSCVSCVLGGGKHNTGKCDRKDNSAKPELDNTLSIENLYDNLKQDCENSSSCAYLNLRGEYEQYEHKNFMSNKKFKFNYGWNKGVKKWDYCHQEVNLPVDFIGGINLIPSGLNNTSAIVAYNNQFSYEDPKDDWFVMDNKVLSTLMDESSYESRWYDINMPRVDGRQT
jgi:hypothetical protein